MDGHEFYSIPAEVFTRTKNNSREVIGDAHASDLAECIAYVQGAPFGPWYGGGDVGCGYQASVSSFIEHVDAFAGAAAVQFRIEWPAVPENAVRVAYMVYEGAGSSLNKHNTGGAENYDPTGAIAGGWVEYSSTQICVQAWVQYWIEVDDPECEGMTATDITATGATLHGASSTHFWWGEDSDQVGQESETGVLTGLKPDTWYWFRALSYCEEKLFRFKTKIEDDDETWQASIITLPATEVWATGATIHGLFWYKGNSAFYVYLGFEYGRGTLTGNSIVWLYSLGQPAREWGERGFKMPIQMTIAGLLPDNTYNYRACLHVGTPPMNANNYFGATMSFGGPVSMFGFGREYVTAKKAEDDIARMAAGRYYMDKEGVFQYESYLRRII